MSFSLLFLFDWLGSVVQQRIYHWIEFLPWSIESQLNKVWLLDQCCSALRNGQPVFGHNRLEKDHDLVFCRFFLVEFVAFGTFKGLKICQSKFIIKTVYDIEYEILTVWFKRNRSQPLLSMSPQIFHQYQGCYLSLWYNIAQVHQLKGDNQAWQLSVGLLIEHRQHRLAMNQVISS